METEKSKNGGSVEDETKKKKKSKKHKKHKRVVEENVDKIYKKKKKSKKEKHKSPKQESETSLSDVEELMQMSGQIKQVVRAPVETPVSKPRNGNAPTKSHVKIITYTRKVELKPEPLEIISSNSETENYQEDCASPELTLIEDDLNLEELMRQKELLQARLVACGSEKSDDEGDDKSNEVICINDDTGSPVLKKPKKDKEHIHKRSSKHKFSKDRSTERDKHKVKRHEEDLREIINRESRKEMERRLEEREYRERKEKERRKLDERDKRRERDRDIKDRERDIKERERERERDRRSSEIRRRGDRDGSRVHHRSRERSPPLRRDYRPADRERRSRERNVDRRDTFSRHDFRARKVKKN